MSHERFQVLQQYYFDDKFVLESARATSAVTVTPKSEKTYRRGKTCSLRHDLPEDPWVHLVHPFQVSRVGQGILFGLVHQVDQQ